jgi:hypothetical protein
MTGPNTTDGPDKAGRAAGAGKAGKVGRSAATGSFRALARLAIVSALAVAAPAAAPALAPLTLQVPGRSSAHISLTADGLFIAAVWSASLPDGATDIYAATSRDGGATFSAPARVNSTAGDARVNGEQPPRVALARRAGNPPVVTVVWTAKGAAGTVLQTARSVDGALTFARSATVAGTDVAGNRGWEAITADARGQVHLAWLDHRRMAQAGTAKATGAPASHHDHAASTDAKSDGVAMAQLSDLYLATLDSSQSPRGITAGVCYCCKTALAVSPDGTLNVAWRHVYPGNLRDIAFASSKDGRVFSAPVRVSQDKWELNGCPDDGPAMTVDSENEVHVIWPTLATGDKQQPTIGLFYASSKAGAPFSQRIPMPTEGVPHHPQVAVVGGSLVAAWDEIRNGVRQVVVARSSLTERTSGFARLIAPGSTGGVYPSLISTDKGSVVAWTSGAGPNATVKVLQVP